MRCGRELTILILHRINYDYSETDHPRMRWCGSKILKDGTANRIFWQNQWWLRPWTLRNFQLIFTGVFHDISVTIWPAYEFNKLLLSPPRFRRTLIVYFQLIMKICYRNWYWCLSRPSRVRWAAEKIVRKCSVPGVCSAQSALSLSVQFLFFAEIARRSLAEREGGNIQILKSLKEKTSTRTQRGALSLHLFISFFRVTSLQQ